MDRKPPPVLASAVSPPSSQKYDRDLLRTITIEELAVLEQSAKELPPGHTYRWAKQNVEQEREDRIKDQVFTKGNARVTS